MMLESSPNTPVTGGQTPGKIVGDRVYVHLEGLPSLNTERINRVAAAERAAQVLRGEQFNVVRIDERDGCVALLHYPEFFEDPFPALRESWRVDLQHGTVSYRTYADSLNPPILHRKELMLPTGHPMRQECEALTAAAESVGLFDQPTRIGYRRQWLALVREKGYRIDGHGLAPLGNVESDEEGLGEASPSAAWQASRQLTALTRYGFSAPIQSLARYGLLDGRFRLFDYGCGRGDDLRGLVENGLSATGWDPYYAPEHPLQAADIVNLGFVINVIEDFDERVEALTRAWSLAERLLVVSVMLANQNDPRGVGFRDGVMTQRGTFQKYYTQMEIKAFLERILDEEAIPVAPGVLYLFRDKALEQRFWVDRSRGRRNPVRALTVAQRERPERPRRDRAAERYEAHREPLERLWALWLTLGRPPDRSEMEGATALVEGFGSMGKALRFIATRKEPTEIDFATTRRTADLQVYFALSQFERRRPYTHLERGLQRDIKAFFGNLTGTRTMARDLLFRIADVSAIETACHDAVECGLGWLEAGRSLQLHASLVEQLPPLLRVYIGCVAAIYGDYRNADLVKIHIGSGKVSLMRYDDFEGQSLPCLIERVKIKLREQDFEYYAYGEAYEPPVLYHKSRYINEEFPNYPEQIAFEEALDGLGLFDLSGYGPRPGALRDGLVRHRWEIAGFQLGRAADIPDLDAPCGRFLVFRDLIACGETQGRTGLPNLPKRAESYNALHDLAVQVLDPVIDYFGMIRLTYGFSSPELTREIPGGIDQKRDQHAACEHSRRGNVICKRLGAAVDFLVEDEDMLEVARWVVTNTPFDRLYFYGNDKPIHVSFGPNHDRQIVRMVSGKSGRLTPRVTSSDKVLRLP